MTPKEAARKVLEEMEQKMSAMGVMTTAHYEAGQELIEKAILEDRARWHAHFRHIESVLGPQPMCKENDCEGCLTEMESALESARLALKEMQAENTIKLV